MPINLYLVSKEEISLHKEKILSLVDDERRRKSLSYQKEDDLLRSLGVGYLYVKILGKTPSYDAKGRPFFENGPYISIGHSGLYSVLAVSEVPVGVDIEEIKSFPEKTKRFFDVLPNDEAYFGAWCHYEAFAKCVGLGLGFPLTAPMPLGDEYTYKGKKYSLQNSLYDNHIIATASEGEKQEIKIHLVSFDD